jgi:hypothetical protein
VVCNQSSTLPIDRRPVSYTFVFRAETPCDRVEIALGRAFENNLK